MKTILTIGAESKVADKMWTENDYEWTMDIFECTREIVLGVSAQVCISSEYDGSLIIKMKMGVSDTKVNMNLLNVHEWE